MLLLAGFRGLALSTFDRRAARSLEGDIDKQTAMSKNKNKNRRIAAAKKKKAPTLSDLPPELQGRMALHVRGPDPDAPGFSKADLGHLRLVSKRWAELGEPLLHEFYLEGNLFIDRLWDRNARSYYPAYIVKHVTTVMIAVTIPALLRGASESACSDLDAFVASILENREVQQVKGGHALLSGTRS